MYCELHQLHSILVVYKKCIDRPSKMAFWVEELAAPCDDLSLIPRIHRVRGKNGQLKTVL